MLPVFSLLLLSTAAPLPAADPWARAVALVDKMTMEEKMTLVQGNKKAVDPEGPNGGYVGIIPGIPRLGIPALRMNDGPEGAPALVLVPCICAGFCSAESLLLLMRWTAELPGFRVNALPGTSTQWPSGLAVAHSWDAQLFGLWGTAMGKEFHDKGANVQFGPGGQTVPTPTHCAVPFPLLSLPFSACLACLSLSVIQNAVECK